ncbi:hypothetical protein [Candidatus Accumulibacter sp. ACC003]|uniref:hypothetical protein n=1 Tax=Candidatus Accumulibacter sp. ACC003 TaxID=2823334 RepID=UPI0025C361A0|nr:hypothetical protein [Candidatus Accumulibacter sp. ACC003]
MQRKTIVGAVSVALSLALSWPQLVVAQTALQLPSGDEDYRQLQQEQRSGPCQLCGVVFAIRTLTAAGSGRRDPAAAARRNVGAADAHMVTAPIIGTGSTVKDDRQARAPVRSYELTIRYEDGSFASITQSEPPLVHKGDRVRVVDGRVELRND